MKTRITMIAFAMVAMLSVAFTSCKDDDKDYDPKDIYGKWEVVEQYSDDGNWEDNTHWCGREFILETDGTFNFRVDVGEDYTIFEGRYTREGDKLTGYITKLIIRDNGKMYELSYDTITFKVTIESLSNGILTIEYYEEIDESGEKYSLTTKFRLKRI